MHFLSVQGSERRATAQRERERERERERGGRERASVNTGGLPVLDPNPTLQESGG